MQAVHQTSELSADEREVIERLLGRTLGENEAFRLSAPVGTIYKEAPTGTERDEAARKLKEHVERMSARTKDMPEEELNAAIDEALGSAPNAPVRQCFDANILVRASLSKGGPAKRLLDLVRLIMSTRLCFPAIFSTRCAMYWRVPISNAFLHREDY